MRIKLLNIHNINNKRRNRTELKIIRKFMNPKIQITSKKDKNNKLNYILIKN
mgnify:CR=1 FL=1